MKKLLFSLFLIAFSCPLFSQSFFGVSSNPGDNVSAIGATSTITPPANMQSGDLVVIHAQYRTAAATLSVSTTGGQTWTSETANSGSTQTARIFWSTFNGTWAANPVISGGNGSTPLTAVMYVFRPSAAGARWTVHNTLTNSNQTNAAAAITGFNTTADKTVSMAFWSIASSVTWSTLSGNSWSKTSLAAQYRNAGGSQQSHTAAYRIRTTSGNVADVTQTRSGTGTTRTGIMSWAEVPPPPANDNCANALFIKPASFCITGSSQLAGQTLNGATVEGAGIASCGSTTSPDVWYKFVTPSVNPTIKLTNIGSGWGGNGNVRIQLLSGTCGAMTQVACANGTTLSVSSPALTIGNTYYLRIHKNTDDIPVSNFNFDICITAGSSRMNEVFKQTTLSGPTGPPSQLNDPWEVTYGPDNYLWITEAKGYRVNRIHPNTGARTTVLDISQNSTFLGADTAGIRCRFGNGSGAQGGLAGLALHPKFLDPVAPQNYVYISYVFAQVSSTVFVNKIVRFTYNTGSNRLESPVSLVDSLPGSSDHNSQRMIIAPVNGTHYLFYASGDMGAGQFGNHLRTLKAQWTNSYEGKILRFNLVPDGDAGTFNRWIPNDNPFNTSPTAQSAVWALGLRNNQGFAYDPVLDKLYGSSHGPFSDDEINIIEKEKNYGHPLVVGYAWDNNANGTTAGAAPGMSPAHPSSCPWIDNEVTIAAGIPNYKDPLFSAYPSSERFPSLNALWNTTPIPNNGEWPSEGWSGLDLYTNSIIPGWKRSLVAASLKWGRLVKLKLNATGDSIIKTAGYDTVSYFGSVNRYRDLAFAPNGRDIFVIMDKNASTSGPSAAFPVVPACGGCLQKYTFLGYTADPANGNRSNISNAIPVAPGKVNVFEKANEVVINAANDNNNLWVPITDSNSNIVAEIHARGQNLGTVTSHLFTRNGVSRSKSGKKYMNRNITITPQTQPSTPVWIRLYISKEEYDAFIGDGYSGSINGLSILKNTDSCRTAITANTLQIIPSVAEPFGVDNGYVLQGEISSFSSFYFSNAHITLPVELVSFKATLQNNATLLQWETANEISTSHFEVERSIDGRNFDPVGNVKAVGINANFYSHLDYEVNNLPATVVYYRLKMVDIDTRFTYSTIVSVNLGDVTNRVILSPNPTAGDTRLMVTAEKEGTAVWKITDNNGREVLRNSFHIRKGNNNILLNLRGLKNGVYYLQVTGTGINQNLKLQKL